ncbi:hypothetical protein FB451DRAFT_1167957 [Mycena latifolia]|nr:hypothetical protein FB451DRAFT_1167957 [Mycena latifolia]
MFPKGDIHGIIAGCMARATATVMMWLKIGKKQFEVANWNSKRSRACGTRPAIKTPPESVNQFMAVNERFPRLVGGCSGGFGLRNNLPKLINSIPSCASRTSYTLDTVPTWKISPSPAADTPGPGVGGENPAWAGDELQKSIHEQKEIWVVGDGMLEPAEPMVEYNAQIIARVWIRRESHRIGDESYRKDLEIGRGFSSSGVRTSVLGSHQRASRRKRHGSNIRHSFDRADERCSSSGCYLELTEAESRFRFDGCGLWEENDGINPQLGIDRQSHTVRLPRARADQRKFRLKLETLLESLEEGGVAHWLWCLFGGSLSHLTICGATSSASHTSLTKVSNFNKQCFSMHGPHIWIEANPDGEPSERLVPGRGVGRRNARRTELKRRKKKKEGRRTGRGTCGRAGGTAAPRINESRSAKRKGKKKENRADRTDRVDSADGVREGGRRGESDTGRGGPGVDVGVGGKSGGNGGNCVGGIRVCGIGAIDIGVGLGGCACKDMAVVGVEEMAPAISVAAAAGGRWRKQWGRRRLGARREGRPPVLQRVRMGVRTEPQWVEIGAGLAGVDADTDGDSGAQWVEIGAGLAGVDADTDGDSGA